MNKFIEINRLFAGHFMRDIIRTDEIVNVYIDQPDAKEVKIVCVRPLKGLYIYHEKYRSADLCKLRFEEISKYLDAGIATIPGLEDVEDEEAEADAKQTP